MKILIQKSIKTFILLASGEISHLMSGETDQS